MTLCFPLIRARVHALNPAVMGILISKYPDTREHALSSGDGSFRRYPDTRALVTMRGDANGVWISTTPPVIRSKMAWALLNQKRHILGGVPFVVDFKVTVVPNCAHACDSIEKTFFYRTSNIPLRCCERRALIPRKTNVHDAAHDYKSSAWRLVRPQYSLIL